MRISIALFLISLAMAGCTESRGPAPVAGGQTPQVLDKAVSRRVVYDYLLYLPKSYDSTKSYPLVIFLHGVGERGADVNKVMAWGPPKLIAAGQQYEFILAAPQCPEGRWWRVEDLEVLLADLLEHYPVDRSRIYLTGLSMGGCATWDWIMRDPKTFAAAVPVCGWGNAAMVKYALPTTAVWAFHGEADPVIPVDGSTRMVEALRKEGKSEAKITIYPKAGHNAWSPTYDNPEVFRWMLGHRLEK